MPRLSRRQSCIALMTLGILCLSGATYGYEHRGYTTPSNTGVVPTTAPLAVAAPRAPLTPSAQRSGSTSPIKTAPPHTTNAPAGPPVRLTLDDIGADARVVPVGVQPTGALTIPSDPKVLGWWKSGSTPGSTSGTVVVVGHVDSAKRGHGALFHLSSARLGALVTIATTKGSVHYRVVARRVYEKSDLPRSVFATNGAPRLVLITCGGPFNSATHHYRDNVVVYAVPA